LKFAVGIRRGTVKTIEKITGTMKLVAQAQLLGTTKKARESSHFFLNIKAMLDKFPQGTPAEGANDNVLSMVITSNRGLCGSLNSQLLRDLVRMPEVKADTKFLVLGDKGATVRAKGISTLQPIPRASKGLDGAFSMIVADPICKHNVLSFAHRLSRRSPT
jgi:ATP synthase F1 gamma subunit